MTRTFCIAFSLVVLAGCSSSSGDTSAGSASTSATGSTSAGSGGAAASSGITTGSSMGGGPVDCMGPGATSMDNVMNIGSVTAKVVDGSGAPVANMLAQVCGLDKCINGTTNASGDVVVGVNQTENNPAFKYGDGLTYARFAVRLTDANPTFASAPTVQLPASGAALAAGADATSGGVTISIPSGGGVEIDIVNYDTPDKQQFRAALMPAGQTPLGVDPTMSFGVIYGVSPIETEFCPAAKVSVPNTPMWAAGTAVEFWTLGLDTGEEYVHYATWQKISDGAVSSDGKTIETSASGGMPVLSSFAIRQK